MQIDTVKRRIINSDLMKKCPKLLTEKPDWANRHTGRSMSSELCRRDTNIADEPTKGLKTPEVPVNRCRRIQSGTVTKRRENIKAGSEVNTRSRELQNKTGKKTKITTFSNVIT